MGVQSTRGTMFHMEKAAAAPVAPDVTDITKASPAHVTVTSAAGLENDGVITITGSDFTKVDGIPYVIANLVGNEFDLLGCNTTDETATFNSGTVAASALVASDLELLAPSAFDPQAGTTTEIDIGTFVTPEATLPGNQSAGSYALQGFTDKADVGYHELLQAGDDGKQRALRITVPGQDFMVASIFVSPEVHEIPLSGAPAYTFSGTFATRLRHLFA